MRRNDTLFRLLPNEKKAGGGVCVREGICLSTLTLPSLVQLKPHLHTVCMQLHLSGAECLYMIVSGSWVCLALCVCEWGIICEKEQWFILDLWAFVYAYFVCVDQLRVCLRARCFMGTFARAWWCVCMRYVWEVICAAGKRFSLNLRVWFYG